MRTWATGIGPLGTYLKSPPNYRPPPEGMASEVVGVVKDVNNVPLGQTVEPAIYFSTRQFPFSEVFIAVKATDRVDRTDRDPQRAAEGRAQRADEHHPDMG